MFNFHLAFREPTDSKPLSGDVHGGEHRLGVPVDQIVVALTSPEEVAELLQLLLATAVALQIQAPPHLVARQLVTEDLPKPRHAPKPRKTLTIKGLRPERRLPSRCSACLLDMSLFEM